MDNSIRINLLQDQLNALSKRHDDFFKDIIQLRQEINQLKLANEPKQESKTVLKKETILVPKPELNKQQPKPVSIPNQEKIIESKPKVKSDWEKFIGENLINKIGILFTIIGVGIGAKYSIEHDLISPLTRIVLGYLVGIGLLGFGMKLKKNYTNYSSVLVSGAMAIFYFITFSAYTFYGLIPQLITFGLMVVFTAFTVFAAVNYKKQIIALIGLVGAYAVPYLLSDGTGKMEVLFSYVAIINVGILVLSFKKYWKVLYYSAFGLTWLMFSTWFVIECYSFDLYQNQNLIQTFVFLSIFFTTFYVTFLAYKVIRKETFAISDIVLLLTNSFIFYGLGYLMLENHEPGAELLGLFTLLNAIIHFIVSVIVYKRKMVDQKVIFLLATLVLSFITIAIPVQLNGNWVTLLWIAEATILFWIGRTRKVPFYEVLAYIGIGLAEISLCHDWALISENYYETFNEYRQNSTAFFNIHFLSGILFSLGLGTILWIHLKKNGTNSIIKDYFKAIKSLISVALLIVLYVTFRLEIVNYWTELYANSMFEILTNGYPEDIGNKALKNFRAIWIISFSMLFVSALTWLNYKRIKNELLTSICFGLNILAIFVFLIQSDYESFRLMKNYLNPSEYFNSKVCWIIIRYVSYAFLAINLLLFYIQQKSANLNHTIKKGFEIFIYGTLIWIASNELIYWLSFNAEKQLINSGLFRYSLSILWGISSLTLIAFGILKNKKHIRVSAMVLFGITLVKLFLFDLAHLSTIPKTIVFVCLGILLLIISYLYNKFKNKISQ